MSSRCRRPSPRRRAARRPSPTSSRTRADRVSVAELVRALRRHGRLDPPRPHDPRGRRPAAPRPRRRGRDRARTAATARTPRRPGTNREVKAADRRPRLRPSSARRTWSLFDSGSTVAQVAAHIPRAAAARERHHRRDELAARSSTRSAGWDEPAPRLPRRALPAGPPGARRARRRWPTCASCRPTSSFIGCDGLTGETGLTTPHVLVAEVGATMVAPRPPRRGRWPTRRSSAAAGFTPIAPLDGGPRPRDRRRRRPRRTSRGHATSGSR